MAIDFDETVPNASTEDTYIQHETDQLLERKVAMLLAQLPARQKEVIYLRYYQGLRPEEIALLLAKKPIGQ